MHYSTVYLLLSFVLLPLLVSAAKPVTVGATTSVVHIMGVAVSPQRIYLPQINEMQKAVYPYTPKRDDYGNVYITVRGHFDLSVRVTVNSSHLIIVSTNTLTQQNNKDMSLYLETTPLINANDPLIKSVARSITRKDNTPLKEISDLAMWVNNHVQYDDKYSDVYLSGVETLKTGKGVCDEYTNLYASLARSLGIPTKVVVGLVYSGSSWQLHAWAESYVDGTWVPVDPTFAEIGQIDATHIVLYQGPTYPFYVSPHNTLTYSVSDVKFFNFTTPLTASVNYTKHPVSRGLFNVTLHLSNRGNTILIPTYLLQTSEGFQLTTPRYQYAVLYPHTNGTIIWRLVAPYGEKNVYYLGVVGPNMDVLLPVNIKKQAPKIVRDFGIKYLYSYAESNNVTVVVDVANLGNLDLGDVKVSCSLVGNGTQVKHTSIPVGGDSRVIFYFPFIPGEHQIYVRVSAGNQTESEYTSVILSTPHKESSTNVTGFIEYLNQNSTRLFLLLVALILIFLFILFLSVHPPKKEPFGERDKWRKLLKMNKLK